jgi:serine protease
MLMKTTFLLICVQASLVNARLNVGSHSHAADASLVEDADSPYAAYDASHQKGRALLEEEEEEVKIMISYKNEQGRASVAKRAKSAKSDSLLTKLHAMGAVVQKSLLQSLDADPDIEFWEEDPIVRPLDLSTYGMTMIQAESPLLPAPQNGWAPCSDPNSFKIAIIDGGADAFHPDIPCHAVDDPDTTNCYGKTFGLYNGEKWYQPDDPHGTHVMGIIGALGNGIGVKGVLSDYNVCYLIARVFGANGEVETSTIIDAAEWAVQSGASVINMSLGGPGYSRIAERAYQDLKNRGAMIFAAAGNGGAMGVSQYSFPASYGSVISVAAVDANKERAFFSDFNDAVQLAAPGQAILSTVPMGQGSVTVMTINDVSFILDYMEYSVESNVPIEGSLVPCPGLGMDTCPGYGGHICLIERGEIFFEDKAASCQESGGIAAIIYNNVLGPLEGTLSLSSPVTIPVLGMSLNDGKALWSSSGQLASISTINGYAVLDGTSMASPAAAGVAGRIWRECQECTREHVAYCIQETAQDIGLPGPDEYFGWGLVQEADAYRCLIDTARCCQEATTSMQYATSTPSATRFNGSIDTSPEEEPHVSASGMSHETTSSTDKYFSSLTIATMLGACLYITG